MKKYFLIYIQERGAAIPDENFPELDAGYLLGKSYYKLIPEIDYFPNPNPPHYVYEVIMDQTIIATFESFEEVAEVAELMTKFVDVECKKDAQQHYAEIDKTSEDYNR